MIPAFDPSTGYLPIGVHDASWADVVARFSYNAHRIWLVGGLYAALKNLEGAGCCDVLLNGSFVTTKPFPNDYDAGWEIFGVELRRLDPVLLDFKNRRAAMKAKYLGDLFPASLPATSGETYRQFFQHDLDGAPKGIVHIPLGSLP